MERNSYWDSVTRSRVSRRKALAGTAGVGLGALALSLIGCGGGESGTKSDQSGLISKPEDSTTRITTGGTLRDFQNSDYLHLDRGTSDKGDVAGGIYPQIFKFAMAKYPNIADGNVEGEVAESYEVSSDKMQLTIKIRQGMKWDSRAPTNGRQIDAQDVLFSWNKFKGIHPNSATLAYDATNGPTAPIESVSSPDSRTVVFKFKRPDQTTLVMLSAQDFLSIQPKEAESQFDPKRDDRGHSLWILDKHEPSVGFTWRRNPDYYMKGMPYIDRWERPIVPEYAQQLAQFRAGNIYTPVALPTDVVQTKKDLPATLMQQVDAFLKNGQDFVFGYDPDPQFGESPFKDVRMRQAALMALDRTAYADVMENRDLYAQQGIDIQVAYNSVIWAGWSEWVDPNDEKAFGSEAKYLKLNIAEVKKLQTAAGYPNGVEFPLHRVTDNYGAEYQRSTEIVTGMLLEAGLKPRVNPITYADFLLTYTRPYVKTTYASKQKGYGGILAKSGGGWASLPTMLFGLLHSDGSIHHASSPDGKNPHLGDPKVDSMLDGIKSEFDNQKRVALIHDYMRYATSQAYYMVRPSTSKGFTVAWPAIGNYGLRNSMPPHNVSSGPRADWWIDASKAPLGKS